MEIRAEVLDEAVRRHIIKVLGRRDLRCIHTGQIHLLLLDHLQEAVKLRRNQEGVYRVSKKNQLCFLKDPGRFGEILLEAPDLLCRVNRFVGMLRKQHFQILDRLQCNAVVPRRRTIYNDNLHDNAIPRISYFIFRILIFLRRTLAASQ